MLTKVIIENFKSFSKKQVFDLTATKYQALQDTNVFDGVLKSALIVGPNATGKSNLILSIKKLLDILFVDNYKPSPFDICVFDSKNYMSFEYHFKFDSSIVKYLISLDRFGVIKNEALIINEKEVLNRLGLSGYIVAGEKVISLDGKFTPLNPLLKVAYFNDAFINDVTIKKMIEYLKNSMYFNASEKKAIDYNNTTHLIHEINEEGLCEVNQFLDKLGIGFNIEKTDQGRTKAFALKLQKPVIFFKRKNMSYTLPIDNESLGNQTLINMLPSIIYNLKTPSMLLIDEFSSGMHNKLEEVLIRYLMKHTKNSQIIFASHSTNLLNTRLLRPDQIYTVDFVPEVGSVVARFSDENPREAQNLEKMYLSGKFGAIPTYK